MICSYATGAHEELLQASAPTFTAYAERWDWDVVLSTEPLTSRPPSWAKIVLARELLAEYDTVLWVDADAVIVDLARPFDATYRHPISMAFHEHPGACAVANAGVFLAHRGVEAFEFLDEVWRSERHVDHNWWENAAVVELMGQSLTPPFALERETRWRTLVGELPLDWNSVPGYCESPTPVVNHHARADHDDFARRLAAIRADAARALGAPPGGQSSR